MNRIGWCDSTWNPVWGCLNNCEYCYARNIAKRFWKQIHDKECLQLYCDTMGVDVEKQITKLENLKDFKPTFLQLQFDKKLPKKPQRIFVGSMSDIFYWDEAWIDKVKDKIDEYPQHIFQFLTKFPETYNWYEFPENCWLGITITKNNDMDKQMILGTFTSNSNIKYNNQGFISFEPLLENIDLFEYDLPNLNWVIIGAETGNRKGKVIPEREWIADIIDCCRERNIPVYLKDSLKNIYPESIKEFPKENTNGKPNT